MKNSKPVIYNASAGAGKTDTLAIRYVAHILQGGRAGEAWRGYRYRSTLCVTFTRKATAEMKERILRTLYNLSRGEAAAYIVEGVANLTALAPQEIQQRAGEALHAIVHDYSQLSVSTIDSFIQRMATSLLWELGVGGEMRVSLSTRAMVDAATKQLFSQPALPGSDLLAWLSDLLEERLAEGGDYRLSEMVADYGDTLFRDSFAGQRVEERDRLFSLERERAVREAIESVRDAGAHRVAIARSALVAAMEVAGIKTAEEFKGKSRSFMKSVLRETEVTPTQAWNALSNSAVKAYSDPDEWFGKDKREERQPVITYLMPVYRQLVDAYTAVRRSMLTCKVCRPLLANISALTLLRRELNREERASGVLLLEDLATMLLDLGGEQEASFIYERMGTRYDSFLIDEFQDTSRRHWRLFVELVRNGLAEGGLAMLVGDVKQAIYRFRGGDWKLLAHEIPDSFGVEPIHLEYNYRSSYNVVQFNNYFFRRLMSSALVGYCEDLAQECDTEALSVPERERFNAKRREYLGDSACGVPGIVQQAYSGVEQLVSPRTKEGDGYVQFCWFLEKASDEAKAQYPPEQYVVAQLEQVIDRQGVPQRDVAVLVRRNEEAADVLTAVLANNKNRKGKEPIRIITSDALSLDSSPDVQLVLSVLRMAVQPDVMGPASRGKSLEWIVLSRYCMPESLRSGAWTMGLDAAAAQREREWIASLAMQPLLEAFDAVCTRYGVPLSDAYISDLYSRMYSYQRDESVDARGFLEWYDALEPSERTIELPETLDAVKLLTLHKSKGLEFRVVLVPMCGWRFRAKPPHQWGEVQQEGWPDSLLPFRGVKEARASYFFLDALEEAWLEAIDSVNLLYVAFTRAKEQLYVNAPGRRADSVWKYLLRPVLGETFGIWSAIESDGVRCIAELGEMPKVLAGQKREGRVEVEIKTEQSRRALPRMKQTIRRGRTFEAEVGRQRSRSLGEALHALFEARPSREQFFSAVQPFIDVGVLTPARVEVLWGEVEEDLQRSPLRECFAEGACVFGERDILIDGKVVRPDRVVELEGRAVVIDYKFAGRDSQHAKYVAQVEGYMSALRAMGYAKVEGYLWYVDPKLRAGTSQDRIVRCGE